jgi:hypothetical protein
MMFFHKKHLAAPLSEAYGVLMPNAPTMTETLAALALCASAEWKRCSSSELFDSCGLEFFTEPGSEPADLEMAVLRRDDGILDRHGVRWSSEGRLHITIIATLVSGPDESVTITEFSILGSKEQF